MPFEIDWRQRGGPPKNPSDPRYPRGIDLDLTDGARRACLVDLPYPTPKFIGVLMVRCLTCDRTAMLTTAGRPDDPRTVRLPCKGEPHAR